MHGTFRDMSKSSKPPLPLPAPQNVVKTTMWLGFVVQLAWAFFFLSLGSLLDVLMGASAENWKLFLLPACGALLFATYYTEVYSLKGQADDELSLRRQALDAVFALGPSFRMTQKTGRLISSMTDAVDRASAYRTRFLGSIRAALFSPFLVTIIIAAFVDLKSGLIMLATLPLVPIIILSFQKAFRKVSNSYRKQARKLATTYLDSVQGLGMLRGLNAGDYQRKVIAEEAEETRKHVMRLLAGNQLIIIVADLSFSLAMPVLGTYLAAVGYQENTLSLGSALALVLLSTLLTEPLNRVGAFFYIGMGGIASQKELRRLVAAATDTKVAKDAEEAADIQSAASAEEASPVKKNGAVAVDISNLSFTYPGSTGEVLSQVNLKVMTGEEVAIVGESGGGKSTLVSLIRGFYQPTSGDIKVAGEPVSQHRVGKALSVVSQNTYLFTGSVAANLRLAKQDATDSELWNALEAANLAAEVRQMPHQLQTEVGERGLGLSGGQAQRLALARAILSGSKILILDEPTSQVDLHSEALIRESLSKIKTDKTLITIAHRKAVIAGADKTYRLADGKLAQV
ncbi:MAG: ATP-binding cassette domain-containing protein [Kiritimatiellae bacterium]|nr:ATP-binding cassette domain-containing protein [Kiritimatiellia bacterium]